MLIHRLDNVEINLSDGHKYAVRDIACGENIIKYGQPIGHATADIKSGERVTFFHSPSDKLTIILLLLYFSAS